MADDTEDREDQQTDDVEEQSEETSDDQADDEESGVDDDAEGDDDEEAEEEEDGDDEEGEEGSGEEDEDDDDDLDKPILSKEKFDALKKDPEKLLAEMNRAATKKFQKLSAARKATEPYADFLRSYEDSPRDAVVALAEQLGLDIKLPKSTEKAEEAVEKVADKVKALIKKQLGDEYADVADKMGSAVYEAARLVAEEAIKPLKADQDKLINDGASKEAQQEIKSFTKKYPDWRQHEQAMMKVAKQLKPTEGMSAGEYMEAVYHLATRKLSKGEAMKEAVKKINKATSKPGKERTVSDKSVSKKPGHIPSWDESVEAAERGERFE